MWQCYVQKPIGMLEQFYTNIVVALKAVTEVLNNGSQEKHKLPGWNKGVREKHKAGPPA